MKRNYCDSCLVSQALVGGIYAAGGPELEHGSPPPPPLLHPTVSKIMGLVGTRPPFTNDFLRHDARVMPWKGCFLVESAGEILICFKLLLMNYLKFYMEVFKMASGSNALEEVESIGNRAIFVGPCRSLSGPVLT